MAKLLKYPLVKYHPESNAFDCLKMLPKSAFYKEFHNRKARQTRKNFLRNEIRDTV